MPAQQVALLVVCILGQLKAKPELGMPSTTPCLFVFRLDELLCLRTHTVINAT